MAVSGLFVVTNSLNQLVTLRASYAAQCIVIGPVWGFVCVCVGGGGGLCVYYHDNSKLRASIFTKQGL